MFVCCKSSQYDPETEWSSPGGITGLGDCFLDCLDLSSEYHTLDVTNKIEAAVYVRKQKDQRKHRKRPKAKRSQWRVKVKGLVADGEKNPILAQQAETLLHSLRLRFPDSHKLCWI